MKSETKIKQIKILKNAIQKGLNSPRIVNFNLDNHLAKLKLKKRK